MFDIEAHARVHMLINVEGPDIHSGVALAKHGHKKRDSDNCTDDRLPYEFDAQRLTRSTIFNRADCNQIDQNIADLFLLPGSDNVEKQPSDN